VYSSPFLYFSIMANHVLSLEVPTVMNSCILSINDTSIYADIHEIIASMGMNIIVAIGFIIDYKEQSRK